jgi:restriction endonuclease S subunit
MAITNIVKLSELEGAKRLDPEFYHPEKVFSKRTLEKVGVKRIKDYFYSVRQIFDPQRHILNDTAFVFDLSDVKSFFLSGGKIALSSEDVGSTKKMFSQNDVLISRLRPYLEEVSFIRFNGKIKLASTEFIVLRPKNRGYYPEVLFSFLITKPVQNILLWSIAGTEHPRFHEEYLLNLKFPNFSIEIQNRIKELVNEAWKFFSNSQSLYSQAENLLLEELGLKDFKPKYELSYTANLSEAFGAHRIDAEYFQPAYDELIQHLANNFETILLKKFILNLQKGVEVGSENYQEEGKPFVRVSNLSIHGFVERDQKYIDVELYQTLKDTYEPKVGDFLLTKDATPGIAHVVKEPVEGIIASGILKLNINEDEIDKEYLALCINFIIGRLQIERDGGGSVITHWRPEQIKDLQIPILPPEVQQKIASLVQQSHEARKKAKELLDEAKRKVEEAIKNEIKK